MQPLVKKSSHESQASFMMRRIILYFVLGFGMISTVVVFFVSKQSEEALVYERAQSIVALLDVEEVRALSGTSADLNTEAYKHLKTHFIKYREANTEVRFAYMCGVRDGSVFFFLDSEDSISPNYSPPGQVYTEATKTFKDVLSTGEVVTEGPATDRWGTWISGFAPVVDTETGEVIAAVGVDVDARWHYATILSHAAIPALLTFIAFLIVIGGEYLRKKGVRQML